MEFITTYHRTARASLFAVAAMATAGYAQAQASSIAAMQSEVGKRATQLADQVYVEAQNLTLLQEFYRQRDTAREKQAQDKIDSAMLLLSSLADKAKANSQASDLSWGIADFAVSERAAAQLVIANQQLMHSFREEAAQPGLIVGGGLWTLKKFYGLLPGPPGTPEFYLRLLAWARYGQPTVVQKLDVRDSPVTLQEAHRRKIEQLINPGRPEVFQQSPIPSLDDTFIQRNSEKILDSQRELKMPASERLR